MFCWFIPSYLINILCISLFQSHYLIYSLEKSSFLSIQFLWTVLLAILTSLRICSAFAFFIMVTFQLIFRTLLFEFLISSELKKSHVVYKLSYILCSVFAFLPFVFLLHFPPWDHATVHSNHGAFGIYSTSRFVNRRINCCFTIDLYSLYGELYFTEKRANVMMHT